MPFEFLEVEDAFQPDIVSDPYWRKHVRVRYSLKTGESMKEAEDTVHSYISEYIKANTVVPNPYIVEKSVVNGELPVIRYG